MFLVAVAVLSEKGQLIAHGMVLCPTLNDACTRGVERAIEIGLPAGTRGIDVIPFIQADTPSRQPVARFNAQGEPIGKPSNF